MLKYNFSKNIKEYILALVGSYKALFIGLVGGYLGTLINLPLPWLLGSLGLNLCFAFTNFKIVFPTKLLNPIFLIVGIILGGTLNVTLLYKIHLWIFSSLAMLICTIVSTILAGYYFFKVCKFSKFISVLAALPGAFVPISEALLEFGKSKNDKGVLIPQATRVIFIVSFVPIFFINNLGFSEMTGYNYENIYNERYFLEILFLLIICFIFANILKNYKIPSPTLVGAMALSGTFYTFEIINARFPDAFINIAFIFLGTALGTRLNGLKIKELILSLRIEQEYSKEFIIELYLNEIYFGRRSYGVASASFNYFNKSIFDLDIHEYAYLAALPKGPNNYDPKKNYQKA